VYFWRIDDLKRDLAAGSISEAGALPYLLWTGAVTALVVSLPLGDPNAWDLATAAVSAALYVAATVFAFRRNGGSAGVSFLVRYLSISWVVAIRIGVLVGIPVFAVLLAVEESLFEPTDETTALDVVWGFAVELAIYVRLVHHIHDVAGAQHEG
jgi:hypothetical protein